MAKIIGIDLGTTNSVVAVMEVPKESIASYGCIDAEARVKRVPDCI